MRKRPLWKLPYSTCLVSTLHRQWLFLFGWMENARWTRFIWCERRHCSIYWLRETEKERKRCFRVFLNLWIFIPPYKLNHTLVTSEVNIVEMNATVYVLWCVFSFHKARRERTYLVSDAWIHDKNCFPGLPTTVYHYKTNLLQRPAILPGRFNVNEWTKAH